MQLFILVCMVPLFCACSHSDTAVHFGSLGQLLEQTDGQRSSSPVRGGTKARQ